VLLASEMTYPQPPAAVRNNGDANVQHGAKQQCQSQGELPGEIEIAGGDSNPAGAFHEIN
ncbi:MAG: hypothetical protein AAFP69_16280, partial [Planctomycetota bacterium]